MAAHLVTLAPGKTGQVLVNRSDACIVWVADASATKLADARVAAAANYGGPAGLWADADAVELLVGALAAPIRLRGL